MSLSDGQKLHTPTPAEIFDQARTKALELYPNDAPGYLEKFKDCSKAEDVIVILENQVKKFKSFREDRWKPVRKKLTPVVSILLQVVSVVKGTVSSQIPGGDSVFTGLAVLLTATQAQSEKYDMLEKLFTKFDYLFLRFNFLYKDENRSSRELLDEMSARLLAHFFHCIAVSAAFIQKGRFRHWLWGVFGLPNEIKTELQRLEELTQEERSGMNAETLTKVEKTLVKVKGIEQTSIDKKIHDWIAPPNPSEDRNIALDKRLQVKKDEDTIYFTGSWILRDDNFQKWKNWEGSQTLWLYGPSGTGKTVVCATIIEHLKSHEPSVVEFFFNNRSNDNGKQSMSGMVSSFLIQLAGAHRDRLAVLRNFYGAHSKETFGAPSRPFLNAQTKCLRDMLNVKSPVFLIVDALDEHPKYDQDSQGAIHDRQKLLELLTSLSNYPTVRLLVTSRDERDIRDALEGASPKPDKLDIGQESQQRDDIKTYIAVRLESELPFKNWNEDKLDLIWKKLGKETMFRLVSLQLESLKKNVLPRDVQATLDDLPKTLEEMYAQILHGLAPRTLETVLRMFEVMYAVARPLYTEEIAEVFATNFLPDEQVRIIAADRLKDPEKQLLEICSSAFIQLEEDSQGSGVTIVRFAHSSVLDFLQSSKSLSPFRLGPRTAVITLCRLNISAVIYLMEYPNDKHPLRGYAHNYWLKDIKRASRLDLVDMLKGDLDRISLDVKTIDKLGVDCRYWKARPTPLAYACILGLEDRVKQILKGNTRVDTGALHVAAARGHRNILKYLLHDGHLFEDINTCSAVSHATENGHLDAVRFLVQNGACIGGRLLYLPRRSVKFISSICIAAEKNFLEIAKILLKHGANISPEHELPPLHYAVAHGHLEMAQLLINHILKVGTPPASIILSLHEAAGKNGSFSMVELLLTHFPQLVNTQDKAKATPLHKAIEGKKDRIATIKFLLLQGADTSIVDRDGRTPMHLAANRGDVEVVHLLVKQNEALLHMRDNRGRCPLQTALQRGNRTVVEYFSSSHHSEEDVGRLIEEGNLESSELSEPSDHDSYIDSDDDST